MRELVGEIGAQSVPTRYPGSLAEFLAELTPQVAGGYVRSTEEAMKWLKEHRMSSFWKHVLENEAVPV